MDRQRIIEVVVPVVIALISLSVSAWVGYSHNDKAIWTKVTTVEIKQDDDREKIKHLVETVDKIYDKVAGW